MISAGRSTSMRSRCRQDPVTHWISTSDACGLLRRDLARAARHPRCGEGPGSTASAAIRSAALPALGEAAMLADEGNPPQAVYLFAPARVFLDAPDVLAGVPIFGSRRGGNRAGCRQAVAAFLTHFAGPADET